MALRYYVISKDVGRSSARKVTVLSILVAIGTVVMKI